MKHRGLFHIHHPILPYFDRGNAKLEKNIRKYLRFLKKNGITIANFTWHSDHSCRNTNLEPEEISYAKLNLSPHEIFKLVKEEADRMGIIIMPSLEVACSLNTKSGRQVIHILVMHEDARILYENNFVYQGCFPFDKFFDEVPAGSLTVLAHPWRFGCGLAYYLGAEKTNEIIEKHGVLVEHNGWIYPWHYALETIFSWLPFLKRIQSFEKFRLLAKKNFTLDGLKNFTPFWGMDTHAPHLLPGKTGFVEMEIDGELSPKIILGSLRQGKAVPIIPKKINFFRSLFWFVWEIFYILRDEIILEKMLAMKNREDEQLAFDLRLREMKAEEKPINDN